MPFGGKRKKPKKKKKKEKKKVKKPCYHSVIPHPISRQYFGVFPPAILNASFLQGFCCFHLTFKSHPTGATFSFTGSLEPVDLSLMEWAWQSPLLVTQVPRH